VRLAVTGATGSLGGRVARRLADAGVQQRLLVRDVGRAPRLAGAEAVQASFADGDAVAEGLRGISVALMVSAAETLDRVAQHRTFVDSAAAAGVRHIVYVSFFGAAPDATFTLARDHWATEEHIRTSGLQFTFLRDNLYADLLPLIVGDDGAIRGPAGDGRAAVVAQDDIADAAVAVLVDPQSHVGSTYSLTGPEALTFGEMAAVVSSATGRAIRYEPESLDEAYASRASYGAPEWQVDAWVSTYTAVAAGELDGVTDDVPRLSGHPAMPLAELMRRTGHGAR